jgi:outer membrane protein assembly factor BamB
MTRLPARGSRGRVVSMVATVGALLATFLGAGVGPAAAQISASDWSTFLYGPSHSSYNASATAITPSNISGLQEIWRWATPASPNDGTNELWSSPTVVNGVVYIGAEDGYFYAISEATQTVLWSDFLGLDEPKGNDPCGPKGQGVVSTATVADDPVTGDPTVFVNAPNGYLYALNAANGDTVWQGLVDTPSTTENNYYSWGSPLVTNDTVYIGISSDCDSPLIPGGVVAFNQSTGAQVAKWIDVPKGAKYDGASVWSSPALAANGDIVVTTGNGYKHSGEPLYNMSVVELNPDNLAVESYWQIPNPQQINDGDFGGSPTMWTATIDGTSTPMVGACNKNGTFYALEQNDLAAGPVWQDTMTVPYPGGAEECDSAADYDGGQLIVGGGAPTTIGGQTYMGSVQSFNPATGAVNWQTGLDGTIVGTPTEDGGGVVAAQTFQSNNKELGVYLLNASTGAIIGFIKTNTPLFGQAVFDQNDLIVGAGAAFGLQAFAVPTIGPPITKVSPSTIGTGHTSTVTLTGSGFSGTPSVDVTGGSIINVLSVDVVSSTTLKVRLFVGKKASLGERSISVTEPGPTIDSCSDCLTIGTPPPTPAPTSITPSSFAPGSSGTAAEIAGNGFASGATVTSHGGIHVSVSSFVSSSQLDVSVSVTSKVAAGTYNLFVHNPGGNSGECKGCLTIS